MHFSFEYNTISYKEFLVTFWHYITNMHFGLLAILRFFCSVIYLGMCVEEFKQGHGQRLYPDVCTLVLLNVIAHGLSLCLSQKHVRLLLQRAPGSCAYRFDCWLNTFTTDWLQTREYKQKGVCLHVQCCTGIWNLFILDGFICLTCNHILSCILHSISEHQSFVIKWICFFIN